MSTIDLARKAMAIGAVLCAGFYYTDGSAQAQSVRRQSGSRNKALRPQVRQAAARPYRYVMYARHIRDIQADYERANPRAAAQPAAVGRDLDRQLAAAARSVNRDADFIPVVRPEYNRRDIDGDGRANIWDHWPYDPARELK